MPIFNTIKQGQVYLKTWPLEPKLGLIFPENRIIKATQFAQRMMPFVAVFAIVWQQIYAKGNITSLAAAVLTAVFALCIPLQGLYWLGKRADTELPAQTMHWFYKICNELQKVNVTLPVVRDKPRYRQLAEVLNKAKVYLNADFWQAI